MNVQPLRGLQALGKLIWQQRVVIQAPEKRETMVEISRLADPVDPANNFVVRIGALTTQPMSETEARQRFLEEAVFVMRRP